MYVYDRTHRWPPRGLLPSRLSDRLDVRTIPLLIGSKKWISGLPIYGMLVLAHDQERTPRFPILWTGRELPLNRARWSRLEVIGRAVKVLTRFAAFGTPSKNTPRPWDTPECSPYYCHSRIGHRNVAPLLKRTYYTVKLQRLNYLITSSINYRISRKT